MSGLLMMRRLRMGDTGFPPLVRHMIRQRSDGWCELCGLDRVQDTHHRRPRGAGGSRRESTNTASNALALCGSCHRLCESFRQVATKMGWLVPQSVEYPASVPVLYRGSWVVLDDLGGMDAA